MTNVRGSELRTQRQTVITETEFEEALYKAMQITDTFLQKRARAILCLLRLTGKRRTEIAILPLSNFKAEKGFLKVTFILEKKRKGHVLQKLSTKSLHLKEPLVKPILEYLDYLKNLKPTPKFFLPRVKSIFGHNIILSDFHISGRQVFNIVRSCSETIWPHLFRETVASDIIKEDDSIIASFKVQRRLDLEDFKTGFNYLRRFATDIIRRESEKLTKQSLA